MFVYITTDIHVDSLVMKKAELIGNFNELSRFFTIRTINNIHKYTNNQEYGIPQTFVYGNIVLTFAADYSGKNYLQDPSLISSFRRSKEYPKDGETCFTRA